jgi:hypothetical protein
MHQSELIQVPILVWGGGTGGVAAAIQAARSGVQTLLLTPGGWLGGMVSAAGVCCPDGNELSPWQTGMWGAFLRELAIAEPEGLDQNWVSCFGYRPSTAESLLRRWVAQASQLTWLSNADLLGVERHGSRITAVEVERLGRLLRVVPQLLIDGSDRGDTFPLAEVPFRFGWEPREQWGEPSAPPAEQIQRDPFFHTQPVQSPTWVVMGQLTAPQPPQTLAVQPPQPLPPPFAHATEAFGVERTITYGRLPGGLVMLNWPLGGNDWHWDLAALFQGDPQRREEICQSMQLHSLRFAAALEEISEGWLQPASCFPLASAAESSLAGAEALALMPYWREGRRITGVALIREQDLLPVASGESIAWPARGETGAFSSVAVGNYANDHHYPGADWPLAPKSCRWGGRWSGTPFTIPYGALFSSELDNLLAADKGISSSHMANGATRLQPLVLNIGQAAGAAAALCVQRGSLPAELPVSVLQEALISDPLAPAAPFPLWDTPWHHPEWAQRQRMVLHSPELLNVRGSLEGQPALLDPGSAPGEPGERLWEGILRQQADGTYRLALHDHPMEWPVITLEPALHRWLLEQHHPRPVAMIGCLNPWGPWLRASRLCQR